MQVQISNVYEFFLKKNDLIFIQFNTILYDIRENEE